MHSAQIIGYPLLVIAALELILGLIILRKNPRNSPVNRSAAACSFAAAAWSISASLMYIRLSEGLEHNLFARLSWIGWFTVPAALQTVLFLDDERSRKARVVGFVLYPFWAFVLALCLFSDLIVTRGYVPLPYLNSPGPLEMPARLIGSLMAFWLVYEIVRLRRKVTGYRRTQLSFYLYGTVLFGTGGAVIGGLIQVFRGVGIEPSLSAFLGLPWVLMIFYAITRYGLLDIRLILSRTIAILLLSFCVTALQFLLFKLTEPVVGAVASIFISVPLIGILFFGTPLSANVQQWINDLVLGDRYLYQRMLRQSANAMITILDRDELLRYIVDSVRTLVGVREAFLFVRGEDGTYSTRHCGEVNQPTNGGCVLPQIIISALASKNAPIVALELSSSSTAVSRDLMESVFRVGAELILPLISKGQLLGVLTLGPRVNDLSYLPSDIETLQMLAGHAAVAIENAQLFEDAIRAKALQRESEHIFRSLAETTTAAIFILRGGRIIYANRAGARMSGYGIEELLSMDPWSIVHPSFRDIVIDRAHSLIEGRMVPPQFEFKFITKQGEERWTVTTTTAIELQGTPALLSTMVDVTEIKRTEEERARLYEENERYLRERIAEQERFSAILSTTNDGFWIADDELSLVFVNDAYCRMSGYSRNELLSMSISDVEAEESPAIVRKHTDAILEKGHDRFETRHRRKDGSLIEVEVLVNRFGGQRTVCAFIRDIGERKKNEEERTRLYEENERYLRERIEEQKRFAAVLDTTSEGFWICSENVRFTYVNDAYCRMLGYGREELLSLSVMDVELNEAPEVVNRHRQRIRDQGHDQFETRHRRKDGSAIDLEVTVTSSGTEGSFFAFARDITERKKAETERAMLTELNTRYLEERLAEQERFSAILHATSEGFWIVNEEGRIIFVNDAYCRMSGYRRGELLAMTVADLEAREDPAVVRVHTENIQRTGHDRFETQHRRKDGSFLDLEVSVNRYKDERTLFSFLRDITDRKKAEAEKARYQAEREKILKDLHDGIGGLTTNINLLAEIAQTRSDPAEVRRSLATIADLSRESLSEIRTFLQSLDVKDLTWQAVAAELRHLGSAIIESHDIRFSLTTSLPENDSGPNSMMAMNLFRVYKESLANIVKHARASAVDASLSLRDAKVVLEVRDNGVGFVPKRTAGRGLLNMQSRAAEMSGTLTVRSEKGTRVVLEVPLV